MMHLEADGFSSLSNETLKVDIIAGVSIVTSLLSFLGSASVSVCSIYHKRVLYPEIFPTFHLSVADVLASLSVTVSSVLFLTDVNHSMGSGMACNIISGLITSFYTSAFLMTVVYALEAWLRFRKKLKLGMSLDNLSVHAVSSRWMYLAYAFAWFVPLILAVFLIVKTRRLKFGTCSMCFVDFRLDDKSCWSEDVYGYLHDMRKLIFLVPLVLAIIINMILYIIIWRTYRQVVLSRGLLSFHQRQEERLLQRKACLYQAVFFVCWLPSIIVGGASFTEEYSMSMYYPGLVIQVIFGPLQGLFNSILYGWQRGSFRQALTERSSLLSTNRTSMIFSRTRDQVSTWSIDSEGKLGFRIYM